MRKVMSIVAALFCCLCASAQNGVQYGPWVTNVSGSSATIIWTTEESGMGWVDTSDGRKVYDSFAGRRVFDTFHSVKLKGLTPGQTVEYRIGGQVLTDDSDPRNPKFGAEYSGPMHSFRSFDPDAETCSFTMLNDVHSLVDDYKSMVADIDSVRTDFIFLAGDIAQTGNHDLLSSVKYEVAPLGGKAAGIPVMFARGNHEGRGREFTQIARIWPNDGPGFYYTFRHGPVAVIVFDGGETGEGRSIGFSGGPVYEEYLEEQIEWAEKALYQPEFASAPVKLCILHVPMIDHPDKDDYKLQRWMNRRMVPMLNEAGIDLMLGADLHEFMICQPESMGNSFPIVVNSNDERLQFFCDGHSIRIEIYRPTGEQKLSRILTFDLN